MTDVLLEKAHHIYGGSTAKFWSNCPAWAAEMARLPPQIAGPAALRGTALHTGAEKYFQIWINHLLHGAPLNFEDYSKGIEGFPDDGHEIIEAYWKAVWKNVLEEILTGKQIYLERKLMLSEELDAGGTADVAVLHRDDKNLLWCTIGDLKTGFHRIDPDEEQLSFYLAAANERARSKGVPIDKFKAFVYQPTHSEPYSEHIFTKKKIESATKKYFKAIEESKKDKPKYKVGDHCKFCRAQATCKAYNAHINNQMDLEVVKRKELPPVESLPDETLVSLWKHGEEIETYISAVRKHIIQRFSEGRPLEGLKIIAGVAKRRWASDEIAKEVLITHGIDPTVEKVIGITEAERKLKASGKSQLDINNIMYTITCKPPAPPKITDLSDKRPAIDVVPVNLLDDLSDDVSELI